MKDSSRAIKSDDFAVHYEDDMIHHRSSMKQLSKGFSASRSSSSIDETASNSDLSSSSFSFSSRLGEMKFPCNPKNVSNTTTKEAQVASWLPVMSRGDSKVPASNGEVENGGGMWRLRYRRFCPQRLLAIVPLNRDEIVWEEVEDDLYILLDGRLDRLEICRDFSAQANVQCEGRLGQTQPCKLLLSLGYLLSSKHKDMVVHDEHVSLLASFLCNGRESRQFKLAFVRTLYMISLSTPEIKYNAEKNTHDDSQSPTERLYEFLTKRIREWDDELANNLSSVAKALVYEIRAKCLRNLDLEIDRIRSLTDKGDETAVIIATGAKIVELGIQKSNKALEGQISNAGQKMKGWIDDCNSEDQQKEQNSKRLSNASDRDAVVALAISSSTKRASDYARQSSKRVAESTLDTTLSGLQTIGNKVEESTDLIDQLSPEDRERIKTAGKIGIASVGAVALVAEAVIETGRSLSSKALGVTADVVGHKYGSVAGEVAQDAADTYTNVVHTMGNITLASNGSKLVKTAAKTAGKHQVDEDVEKAKKIMLRLERQGAIVAKQALGIQWTEGSLTRELLCAAASDEETHGSAPIHPKGNLRLENNKTRDEKIDD